MNSLRLITVILLNFYLFSLHSQEIKNLNNFTVVIDPGHGGKDPGAVSNGFYEKIIVKHYISEFKISFDLKLKKKKQSDYLLFRTFIIFSNYIKHY